MPTGMIVLFSVAVLLQFVQMLNAIDKMERNESVDPRLYFFSLMTTLLWMFLWLDK